ncbi:MAG: hypothetical protein Q9184_002418 [Pyrenodesmia sp. 2 TL-2023]
MLQFQMTLGIILYILLFIRSTVQVDVTMDLMEDPDELGLPSQPLTMTCTNLRPGVCCEYPTQGAEAVTFNHLTAFDIAAVWTERLMSGGPSSVIRIRSCSGRLLQSRPGPGHWRWVLDEPYVDRARGASYITLPRSLPPGREANGWMMMEGLLGLAWGGGSWFASDAARRFLGGGGGGGGGGGSRITPTRRARARGDLRAAQKGTVYARPPSQSVFPNRVEMRNGTVYIGHGGSLSDMVFKDEVGNVANLTGLWPVRD